MKKFRSLVGTIVAVITLLPAATSFGQMNIEPIPDTTEPTPDFITPMPGTPGPTPDTILPEEMDAASAARQLGASDFAAAIDQTGMSQQFQTDGPYTLFAPSDEALRSIPQQDVERYRSDPELQKRLMGNHIVKGDLSSQNINDPNLRNLSGEAMTIESLPDGSLTVNGHRIIGEAKFNNGTIYKIDGVIFPL